MLGEINKKEMKCHESFSVSIGISKEIVRLGYPIDSNVGSFNIWLHLRQDLLT